MESILKKLLSNDSEDLREGTKELKEALNQVESVGVLCNLLSLHPDMEIRQYATIILRKRFEKSKNWHCIETQDKANIKSGLLHTFVNEREKKVKNCLAQLIGTIYRHEYPNWVEVISFLQQTTTSDNTNDKELGFYTLAMLTEHCPEQMKDNAQQFFQLFINTMNSLEDKSSPIAFFIIQSMMHFAHLLSTSRQLLNAYNDLLPKVMECVRAMGQKRPDRAMEALDLYYELSNEKEGVLLITPRIKLLVSLCLDLTQQSKLEDLQIKALSFIATLATIKIKAMMKDGLIVNILSVLMAIMKVQPLDDEEEHYFSSDTVEDSLLTGACETLDAIALNCDSPKRLIQPLMELIKPALESSNPYDRKAGYLALGVICQGCESYIRAHLMQDFITVMFKGINDSHSVVRNAALFSLGQFAEHLQPEIAQFALEIMPLLISQLDRLGEEGKDGSRLGQKVDRLFYALERFSETLESTLSTFLTELMNRLITLALPPYHRHIRELALSNIGAAAGAVQEGILPFFETIMNILNRYLTVQLDADDTPLQVEALDTLGVLARHVGNDHFRPLALDSLKIGMEMVASNDDPDIRKSSYGLFGSVSSVLKEEMAPFLETVVMPMIHSIKDQQAYIVHNRDDADAAFPLYVSESEEGSNEEDFDDVSIENDYVEEKEEACYALKELAQHTGESFAPFLETSIEEVYKLLIFPSGDVRKAALEAEAQFCITFVKVMLAGPQGDNNCVASVMEKLIVKTIELIRTDLNRDVVITGLECLQTFLKEIGPQIGGLPAIKNSVLNVVKDVLSLKTEIQTNVDDLDDDSPDGELLDAAADITPLLAKAMTQQEFAHVFSQLLPLLKNRVLEASSSEDEDESDSEGTRANTIGVLAECMSGLGEFMAEYVNTLLPNLLVLTKDPEANVRNNALFTIGEMAYHGKQHVFQHYPTILNALHQVLSTEKKSKVIDNTCGVIARMILTNISIVPLAQVFPALVGQLPLKEDMEEDVWVFRAVVHVTETALDLVRTHVHHLIHSAAFSLETHSPTPDANEAIVKTVKILMENFPNECRTSINQLPPTTMEVLQTACTRTTN